MAVIYLNNDRPALPTSLPLLRNLKSQCLSERNLYSQEILRLLIKYLMKVSMRMENELQHNFKHTYT
jgi:hypothetical protein